MAACRRCSGVATRCVAFTEWWTGRNSSLPEGKTDLVSQTVVFHVSDSYFVVLKLDSFFRNLGGRGGHFMAAINANRMFASVSIVESAFSGRK